MKMFLFVLAFLFILAILAVQRDYLASHNREIEKQYQSKQQKIDDFIAKCENEPGKEIITVPLPDGYTLICKTL